MPNFTSQFIGEAIGSQAKPLNETGVAFLSLAERDMSATAKLFIYFPTFFVVNKHRVA